jgi:hypothetical protein
MKPTVLANTDFTDEFHRLCIWRSPGVILKASNLFTHKLIVEFQDIRLKALIQVNQDCKQIIFLN